LTPPITAHKIESISARATGIYRPHHSWKIHDMPLPVSLREVLDAIEPMSDEWQGWINRTSSELASFSDEEEMYATGELEPPPWFEPDQAERIRNVIEGETDWIRLPGTFEFHEYAVMQAFCEQVDDEVLRSDLLDTIRGSGAFRRFRDMVAKRELEQAWFAWRTTALRDCVIDFLTDAGIPFTEP
jgi:hypothetical protein